MRIAVVVGRDRPEQDGVADHARRLAAGLERTGDDVHVVEAAGRVRRAAKDVQRLAPDVVHVHFAPAAFGYRPQVGLLPALLRAPLVTTVHEYAWWSWPRRVPGAVWRPLERAGLWDRETLRLVPASAAVVCTNEAHRRALRERLGVEPVLLPLTSNVDVVPADRTATRARYGVPPRAPLAVFFGFVHPVKGVRYLLDAVAALRASSHPDLRLVVAGGFETLALPGQEAVDFEAEVRAQVGSLGLDDAVQLLGWTPPEEVSALLQAADVAALPFTHGLTTKSGSLLAVLEHGVPLVGTRGEGTGAALEEAAWLGPVRESAVLAEHLRAALAAGAPRPAAAALVRAADTAALHREVYESVLDRAPARA